ncbi:MAG: hypothetical protein RL018_1635, partial [Pseudomonadota bacterium]
FAINFIATKAVNTLDNVIYSLFLAYFQQYLSFIDINSPYRQHE